MTYTVPTWADSPSTATPLNASNLNQGSAAIRSIDTRIAHRFINVKTDYGATGDGSTNDTTALQNALTAAAVSGAGTVVFFPAGQYRIGTKLTVPTGTVVQGVSGGTYPGNNSINQVSVISRIASMNDHVFYLPDGNNYCRFIDIAVDGNKLNNTTGCGIYIADGAAGQESQTIIDNCYIHDNPDSNIYLGKNRRANKILRSVCNYAGNAGADGITVADSDNTIQNCIVGSNTRAGICLGTTVTQNWAAAASPNGASTTHVLGNDIYGNAVGIAVAAFAANAMIIGNGVDQNTKQGITVYDGTSTTVLGNAFHSNGTLTNNTYGHIGLASGVVEVAIAGNVFGQLDGGVTNVASHGITVAGSTTVAYGLGNTIHSTATVNGMSSAPLLGATPSNMAQQLYGYLSWSFDTATMSGNTVLGAAGTVTLIKLPWPTTALVTNIVIALGAGGSTLTTSQNFAGIYDSGGNRLGVTADQSATWNSGGTTPKTMAITGAPIMIPGAGASGFIYVALLWNGTTSPSVNKAAGNSSAYMNGALSAATLRFALNSSALTALPSTLTLSSSTAVGNAYWAALS